MNKKVCPYCHTETYYTGAAGEREAEEPQEYLYNYEFQDDLFSISVYVLKGHLYFKVDDQNGEFADRLKIDYFPKCGRKLRDEKDKILR